MLCITIEHKAVSTVFLNISKKITNFLFWVFWACLVTSIKKHNTNLKDAWSCPLIIIIPTLQETFDAQGVEKNFKETLMFIGMQKNKLQLLTSFLRYCKDIANLLFWELWECLAIPIKMILSICSNLSCLSACQKINFITQFFKILQRSSKLVILGNLGMSGPTNLTW